MCSYTKTNILQGQSFLHGIIMNWKSHLGKLEKASVNLFPFCDAGGGGEKIPILFWSNSLHLDNYMGPIWHTISRILKIYKMLIWEEIFMQ
jgi:hypothetical protein